MAVPGGRRRHKRLVACIGDMVILASYIEGLNKQFPEHDILISQWMHEVLGVHRREFVLVDLGKVGVWVPESILHLRFGSGGDRGDEGSHASRTESGQAAGGIVGWVA